MKFDAVMRCDPLSAWKINVSGGCSERMRRSAVDISDVGFNLEPGKSHNRKWLHVTPASNRQI
jgi:hypothetical protein